MGQSESNPASTPIKECPECPECKPTECPECKPTECPVCEACLTCQDCNAETIKTMQKLFPNIEYIEKVPGTELFFYSYKTTTKSIPDASSELPTVPIIYAMASSNPMKDHRVIFALNGDLPQTSHLYKDPANYKTLKALSTAFNNLLRKYQGYTLDYGIVEGGTYNENGPFFLSIYGKNASDAFDNYEIIPFDTSKNQHGIVSSKDGVFISLNLNPQTYTINIPKDDSRIRFIGWWFSTEDKMHPEMINAIKTNDNLTDQFKYQWWLTPGTTEAFRTNHRTDSSFTWITIILVIIFAGMFIYVFSSRDTNDGKRSTSDELQYSDLSG